MGIEILVQRTPVPFYPTYTRHLTPLVGTLDDGDHFFVLTKRYTPCWEGNMEEGELVIQTQLVAKDLCTGSQCEVQLRGQSREGGARSRSVGVKLDLVEAVRRKLYNRHNDRNRTDLQELVQHPNRILAIWQKEYIY